MVQEQSQSSVGGWNALVEILAGLSTESRSEFKGRMRIFNHDLRQALSQIHSAEELIRRMVGEGQDAAEIMELLDVIRVANQRANEILIDQAAELVEKIELDPESDP